MSSNMPPPPGDCPEFVRTIADAVSDVVIVTEAMLDVPGPRIVHVNEAFSRVTGYPAAEVIGKTPRILQGVNTDRAVLDRMRAELRRDERFFGQIVNYTKQGKEFTFAWNISPLRDANGRVTHWISVQRAHDAAIETARPRRVEALVVGGPEAVPEGVRRAVVSMSPHTVVHDVEGSGLALYAAEELAGMDLAIVAGSSVVAEDKARISALREAVGDVPLVVFSNYPVPELARAALSAGADAFVAEAADAELLQAVLQFVRAGGTYLSWQILETHQAPPQLVGLTRRQREIAGLLAAGMSNQQIAARMSLSVNTVKGHVARTMKALGAENRTQVALLFKGLQPEPPAARSADRHRDATTGEESRPVMASDHRTLPRG